ncbi:winged helix-turn-helix transcriptional regulator [Halocynthiibacter styelae]|uniref:Helix-turn-helix transcriptional regulator n=1 Tax=Halocynthiibacter styelae TaxID=2761955 RepID=A0A8J7IL17_9RHOB|nr:winged helix-turn-helix transcriptional regulator [Paenihalocynthiibacter styelae]MBI1495233.1 helix-turn-helix transcriptional regulator [Paenihalocynthiibacter styelae]
MDINSFVNMTTRAWSLPILSKLHDGVAGRQAPLLAATGAGRTSFGQSLEHLMDLNLLERNPGHGHPLRPEFRLTDPGKAAAELAYRVYSRTEAADQDLLRKSWTLPVLTALHSTGQFSVIRRGLPRITDRALSQSLKLLEDRSWVRRAVDEKSRPLRPVYRAVNTGGLVSDIAGASVRFQIP